METIDIIRIDAAFAKIENCCSICRKDGNESHNQRLWTKAAPRPFKFTVGDVYEKTKFRPKVYIVKNICNDCALNELSKNPERTFYNILSELQAIEIIDEQETST